MSRHPGATIIPHGGRTPRIHETAFIAPGARLIGDVEIGPRASIWYNCVLRGDLNRIVVGAGSNVQDGTVVHVEDDLPVVIGSDVLIGHMAILHGCVVEDRGFVGMGSVVMDGSRIAAAGMLAAGALLPPRKLVASAELWAGRPARPVRALTPAQLDGMRLQTARYADLAASHRASSSG